MGAEIKKNGGEDEREEEAEKRCAEGGKVAGPDDDEQVESLLQATKVKRAAAVSLPQNREELVHVPKRRQTSLGRI